MIEKIWFAFAHSHVTRIQRCDWYSKLKYRKIEILYYLQQVNTICLSRFLWIFIDGQCSDLFLISQRITDQFGSNFDKVSCSVLYHIGAKTGQFVLIVRYFTGQHLLYKPCYDEILVVGKALF